MNRLAPLIVRGQPRPYAPFVAAAWTADSAALPRFGTADDVRLFVTAWLGGLVLFGTLIA